MKLERDLLGKGEREREREREKLLVDHMGGFTQ